MKKKILSILMIGIISLSILSCSQANANSTNNTRFVKTSDEYTIGGHTYNICYDSITRIVYLQCGFNYASGITPLIGQDKQPMTIDEYNKTK